MSGNSEALPLDAVPICQRDLAWHSKATMELRRLHEEVLEQARLNGMGAEREARLMARVEELERRVETLQACSDFNLSCADEARTERDKLRAECRTLVRQNGEWQQQVESLRADAERYRWLRENSTEYSLTQKDGYGGRELMGWEALDAAIDAARSKT